MASTLDDKDRRRLAKLDASLDRDFVIVDEGASPSIVGSIAYLVAGALMLGLTVLCFVVKPPPPDAKPPGGQAPATPPAPPATT
jgi:hypothetical protein